MPRGEDRSPSAPERNQLEMGAVAPVPRIGAVGMVPPRFALMPVTRADLPANESAFAFEAKWDGPGGVKGQVGGSRKTRPVKCPGTGPQTDTLCG
jgi:hypothetical protein